MSAPRLFHLAIAPEWHAAAARGGPYDRSTIGKSLEDEGFIHCSFAEQVEATAARYYAHRDDIVLVVIDPLRLDDELRIEPGPDGEHYPHLYGPLPLHAVVSVHPLMPDRDGHLPTEHLIRGT